MSIHDARRCEAYGLRARGHYVATCISASAGVPLRRNAVTIDRISRSSRERPRNFGISQKSEGPAATRTMDRRSEERMYFDAVEIFDARYATDWDYCLSYVLKLVRL